MPWRVLDTELMNIIRGFSPPDKKSITTNVKNMELCKKRAFLLYCEDLYPWLSTILNNNIWHGGAFNIFILGEEQMVRILSLLKKNGTLSVFSLYKVCPNLCKTSRYYECLFKQFIYMIFASLTVLDKPRKVRK